MRIAINTRLLLKNRLEGIGWFIYQTLKRITVQNPQHNFLFLFDRPFDPSFIFGPNVEARVLAPAARHPFLWYWWFERKVPTAVENWKADLFFSPEGYGSIRLKIPQIVTFHDLSLIHYPEHTQWLTRKYIHHYYPKFAAKANRVITVSEYSKKDIIKELQVSANKIDVSYNGSNEAFKPISHDQKLAVREKYSSGKPYFIYIGALQPRKNISNLLCAFDKFKKRDVQGFKLLLTGRKAWMTGEIEKTYQAMEHKNEISFTGYLDTDVLASLLAASNGLIYVSLFEGFGIPILEAMNCGVPVITSNISSMPEVAGDAAVLTDPLDIDQIEDSIYRLANEPDLAKKLIEAGNRQKLNFSWDLTAEKVWGSITKTMKTD